MIFAKAKEKRLQQKCIYDMLESGIKLKKRLAQSLKKEHGPY